MHVFELTQVEVLLTEEEEDIEGDEHEHYQASHFRSKWIRRASAKTAHPLSSYASSTINKTALYEHVVPPLQHAARHIPTVLHQLTKVYYAATAGMRLVDPEQQLQVWDALHQVLSQGVDDMPPVPFDVNREDLLTLTGSEEGYYGALAVNYLTGRVNAHMQPTIKKEKTNIGMPPLMGSLDLGGSSTQLVFYHAHPEKGEEEAVIDAATGGVTLGGRHHLHRQLDPDDFYKTSFLAYGVGKLRERLWELWISERNKQSVAILNNPCSFAGYEQKKTGADGEEITFSGTGDATACRQQVLRLLAHPDEPDHPIVGANGVRIIGGVPLQPSIPPNHAFLAMSVFFYGLDALRLLGKDPILEEQWPTPTLNELWTAVRSWCQTKWTAVHKQSKVTPHPFTKASLLPHRCFEAVYMVALLEDGYGLDPERRDVSFVYLVNNTEVEWSLGMAMALRSESSQSLTEEKI